MKFCNSIIMLIAVTNAGNTCRKDGKTSQKNTELLNLQKEVEDGTARYISLKLEKEREVTEVTEKNLKQAEQDAFDLNTTANSIYKRLAKQHANSNRQVAIKDEIIEDLEARIEGLEELIVQRNGDLDVAEDQVEDLTEKLEKSNNELEEVKELYLLQSGKLLKQWDAKSVNSTEGSTPRNSQLNDESIEEMDCIDNDEYFTANESNDSNDSNINSTYKQ